MPLVLSMVAAMAPGGKDGSQCRSSGGDTGDSNGSNDLAVASSRALLLAEHAELLLALVNGLGPTAVAQALLSQQLLLPALQALLLPLTSFDALAATSPDDSMSSATARQSSAPGTGATMTSTQPTPSFKQQDPHPCPVQLRLLSALASHSAFVGGVLKSPSATLCIHSLVAVVAAACAPRAAAAFPEPSKGSCSFIGTCTPSAPQAQRLATLQAVLRVLEVLVSGDRQLTMLVASSYAPSSARAAGGSSGASRGTDSSSSTADVLLSCAGWLAAFITLQQKQAPDGTAKIPMHAASPPVVKAVSLARPVQQQQQQQQGACSRDVATAQQALRSCTKTLAGVCTVSCEACSLVDGAGAGALQVLGSCMQAARAAEAAAAAFASDSHAKAGQQPAPEAQVQHSGRLKQAVAPAASATEAEATQIKAAEAAEELRRTSEATQLAIIGVLAALARFWAHVSGLPDPEEAPDVSPGDVMESIGAQAVAAAAPGPLAPSAPQDDGGAAGGGQQGAQLTPESSSASVASMLSHLGKGSLWGMKPANKTKAPTEGPAGLPAITPLVQISEQPPEEAAGGAAGGAVAAGDAAAGGNSQRGRLALLLQLVVDGMRDGGAPGSGGAGGVGAGPAPLAVRHAACCVVHALLAAGREAAVCLLQLQPQVRALQRAPCMHVDHLKPALQSSAASVL